MFRKILLVLPLLLTSCASEFELSQWITISVRKDWCTDWPLYKHDENGSRVVDRCTSDVSYGLTNKGENIYFFEQSIDISRGIYHIRRYKGVTHAETERVLALMERLMKAEGHKQKRKFLLVEQGMSFLYEVMIAQKDRDTYEAESNEAGNPLYEELLQAVRELAQKHGEVLPLVEPG